MKFKSFFITDFFVSYLKLANVHEVELHSCVRVPTFRQTIKWSNNIQTGCLESHYVPTIAEEAPSSFLLCC